jgi:hypothetical protein
LLCSSQAQRSEVDCSVVLSRVRDQQAQLDEERQGRLHAVNAAGRLATEMKENALKHEAHSAQATAVLQSLQGQLQATQNELHQVKAEARQHIENVVKEAEARQQVALQAENARVARLAAENQQQLSIRAELEQQRIVYQSESSAFQRAYQVFEQHSEAGDRQLAQEFEARAFESQMNVGKYEAEVNARAAKEASLQQELSIIEAKLQQMHDAEMAKLAEWSREVNAEKKNRC